MRIVRLILALLVGAVFIYAGVLKARDPMRFASDISNYAMLSWPVGVRVAFFLPWLEIICGLALVTQRFFNGAILVTASMIVVFFAATIWAKVHGIDVACGCFGTVSSNLTLSWHLALNTCLLGASAVLWWSQRRAPAVAA